MVRGRRHARQRALPAAALVAVALALTLDGCEAILGVGNLKDRTSDASVGGDGPGSDTGGDASGSGSGSSSGSDGADAGNATDSDSSDAGYWDAGCLGDAGVVGDAGSPPPSCASGGAGLSQCGPCAESCCSSPEVAAGMYDRTYTNTGSGPSGEADLASVSGFRLDKYLVTVGRFRQFVDAWSPPDGGPGWLPTPGSGRHVHLNQGKGLENSGSPGTYEPGWVASDDDSIAPTNADLACDPYATWTSSPDGQENLPITCVNWWEAYAFCIWDGGFLPSEAEWGYAAAGGSAQLEYPWGATPPGTANQYAIFSCYYPSDDGICYPGVSNIAPVGTAERGAGVWGQLDLAGDALEWTLDWSADYVDPCVDCAYLVAADERVLRGASFSSEPVALDPAQRAGGLAYFRNSGIGFRCARAP